MNPVDEGRLRPATDADAEAIRAVVFDTLREYGLRPDPEGADRDLFAIEASYPGSGGAFAVLETADGRIVGTVGLRPVEGVAPSDPRTVELRKMYLRTEFRGRGCGRRLFDWALEEARRLGFRGMTLETATVLREAVRLYERRGFRVVPHCPNVCRCDLVMEREL